MSRNYVSGIGEALGDQLVTNSPLFVSGFIAHVDSTNLASLNDSDHGESKERPWATLVYALAQVNAGDIIVLHDGHTEALDMSGTFGLDVNKRVIIVGAGASGGEATVQLSGDDGGGTATYLLRLSAAGSEIRNVHFAEMSDTLSAGFVSITATGCRLNGCQFDAGPANLSFRLVEIATALVTVVDNCTFRAGESDVAIPPYYVVNAKPAGGMQVAGGTLWSDGCVFDSGSLGWDEAAFETSGATNLVMENVSVIGGGRFLITESGQNILSIPTSSGAVSIVEQ